jgi:hypothetical protein
LDSQYLGDDSSSFLSSGDDFGDFSTLSSASSHMLTNAYIDEQITHTQSFKFSFDAFVTTLDSVNANYSNIVLFISNADVASIKLMFSRMPPVAFFHEEMKQIAATIRSATSEMLYAMWSMSERQELVLRQFYQSFSRRMQDKTDVGVMLRQSRFQKIGPDEYDVIEEKLTDILKKRIQVLADFSSIVDQAILVFISKNYDIADAAKQDQSSRCEDLASYIKDYTNSVKPQFSRVTNLLEKIQATRSHTGILALKSK